MTNINIGVIGYGYWGPNIVRNFFTAANCSVKMVADGRTDRLAQLAKAFPSVKGVSTADEIINSKEIDAVVIATPVFTHYPLAKKALENGKHVLIEKPMALNAKEAARIVGAAQKNRRTAMVAKNLRFDKHTHTARAAIQRGDLGEVYHARAFSHRYSRVGELERARIPGKRPFPDPEL